MEPLQEEYRRRKKAKNPRTKTVINVPEKNKFVFKPSSKIKYKEEESIYDIGPLAYGRIPHTKRKENVRQKKDHI